MEKLIPKIKLGKYKEVKLDISLSAFEVFKRLYPYFENVFLLESLGEEGKYNCYSYVGFDPLFVVSAKNNEVKTGNETIKVANPFKVLEKLSSVMRKDNRHDGYRGGLVGYFSHEATRYFERAFEGFTNSDYPDFEFGFYTDGLRFDKKTKTCTYFCYGCSRYRKVKSLINSSGKLDNFIFKKKEVSKTRGEHKKMVLEAIEQIKRGNIFQAVLSVATSYKVMGDRRRIYAALRKINPSPYMIYFKFGKREVITASPELLIRIKDKKIEHFGTLAGTIGNGRSDAEDRKLAQKLKKDEKEMAEHMMLVDLGRNDLGRICEFGSVTVDILAEVKKYSHVQHLYSQITGKLRKEENSFTALSACFPAGTLTGAPKIEAMKIIAGLEGKPRGPYGGVGGYFSLNGDCMLAILIRSFFVNGDTAYTQTGSGIVLDSDSHKEYREIINKQKAVEEALELAAI